MNLRLGITQMSIMLFTPLFCFAFQSNVSSIHEDRAAQDKFTTFIKENIHFKENKSPGDTTFTFNLENKAYELCYITKGEIWFYDIKSAKKIKFPYVKKAFHVAFTKDKKTMFYTTVNANKGLLLNKAVFSGSIVTLHRAILSVNMEMERFKTPTYDEIGRMVVFKDTILIEYDFEWLDSFYKVIKYSINNDSALFDQDNPLFGAEYEKATKQKNEHDSLRNKIEMLEIDGKKELFLHNQNNILQLTNTSELDKEFQLNNDEEDFMEKDISVLGISPDGTNLLFGVITYVNDLAHGPYYIVDLEGKNQQMILDDGYAGNGHPVWLPDGKNITTGSIITGENNTIIEIDNQIEYYIVRF